MPGRPQQVAFGVRPQQLHHTTPAAAAAPPASSPTCTRISDPLRGALPKRSTHSARGSEAMEAWAACRAASSCRQQQQHPLAQGTCGTRAAAAGGVQQQAGHGPGSPTTRTADWGLQALLPGCAAIPRCALQLQQWAAGGQAHLCLAGLVGVGVLGHGGPCLHRRTLRPAAAAATQQQQQREGVSPQAQPARKWPPAAGRHCWHARLPCPHTRLPRVLGPLGDPAGAKLGGQRLRRGQKLSGE